RFSGLKGYERLLDTKPEAVFLETPPYCFPEHARASVEAGCHVYIAKPLGCDVPGCLTVSDAGKKATANKRVFLVDFQTRTDPFFIEGIRRVRQGDFGAIGLVSSVYCDEAFKDPPLTDTIESRLQHLIWVNDIAIGGGYLVNAGIHAVDVALWIAGETPVSAMGSSRIVRSDPHGDSRDAYSITYQFANGIVVNHWGEHLKNRFGFKCECIAQCQDGHLEAGYTGQVRILGVSGGYRGGKVKSLYPKGAERNIATFHESITNDVYDNPTVEPGVNATLATLLGRDAARRNGPLSWDDMLSENARCEVDLSGLTM
ncbi:MAG: Gfo/Idh/MocA family oxidoreductase, partial [bacterium]|nr:Gfo/Idh/MocA family oxidoreductase [bacterium]